ncbi:MAG TPA: pitrilysin family protein [Gemmatimonadales bacterium]|nr:pitrilysin family protein [Gemmatimonadales bacterium]
MNTVRLDGGVVRTDAPNGLVVMTEAMPSLRSAAAGFWIRTASAHETPDKMGVSHLLEHMVFKGTERRGPKEIALALESRGGALDAYTGRDHTTFQARILDRDLPLAVDVLDDLIRRPLLREEDLAKERHVVLEEIAMVEDDPDDLVFDLHAGALWPEHSYGFRILGTRDTVSALRAADLSALHRGAYHPRHMVFAAAGNVEHEAVLELLRAHGWLDLPPGPEWRRIPEATVPWRGEKRIGRDSNQVHIVMGSSTFRWVDPRRHALSLITTVFGGGMSSRLFQKVREELGLAYSVYAFNSFHQVSGVCGTYVGTQPDSAEQALEVLRAEYRRLAAESLTPDELASAKQQLKGQLVLTLESPTSRMYRLAGQVLYGDRYRTVDDVLQEIDAVTESEVADVAAEFFDPDRQTLVWLGPN